MTDIEKKMRKDFSLRFMIAADRVDKSINRIAIRMKKNPKTMYDYCYGQVPKLFTFFEICEYLDVSADWLLGRTDKMEVNK